MKTRLFLTMLVAVGATFTSCNKSEDPAPLTKEQATVAVDGLKDSYSNEFGAMDNNDGVKAIDNIEYIAPFTLPDGNVGTTFSKVNSFNSTMALAKKGDVNGIKKTLKRSDFLFAEYVGTWEWNHQTQSWNHTSTPTDKVVLKFPYPSDNATNNAVYTISKYTLEAADFGTTGEFNANITVNGSEVWSIALSGTSSQSSSSISFSLNQKTVYTSIATPKVSYEENEAMQFKMSGSETQLTLSTIASMSIKKNGVALLSTDFSITAKVSDAAYDFLVNGNLRIANIRFEFNIAYKGNTDTSPANLDQYVKINVYTTDGAKVGEMKYESDGAGGYIMMFYYTNGDKVPAEGLFGDVLSRWDDLFGNLELGTK